VASATGLLIVTIAVSAEAMALPARSARTELLTARVCAMDTPKKTVVGFAADTVVAARIHSVLMEVWIAPVSVMAHTSWTSVASAAERARVRLTVNATTAATLIVRMSAVVPRSLTFAGSAGDMEKHARTITVPMVFLTVMVSATDLIRMMIAASVVVIAPRARATLSIAMALVTVLLSLMNAMYAAATVPAARKISAQMALWIAMVNVMAVECSTHAASVTAIVVPVAASRVTTAKVSAVDRAKLTHAMYAEATVHRALKTSAVTERLIAVAHATARRATMPVEFVMAVQTVWMTALWTAMENVEAPRKRIPAEFVVALGGLAQTKRAQGRWIATAPATALL